MNCFLSALVFILFPFVLVCQNKQPEKVDSTYLLNDVIVTATKSATSLLELPFSANKINATQINRFQFRTTPESLIGATGIFLQKTNHGGGSPFIRGLTGNQNLLVIDGIRMNNSTYRFGPNQYLNMIDVFTIGSIEIIRGSGSVQYGSDAMGGVIQVFTDEPEFSKKNTWVASFKTRAISSDIEYTGRAELGFNSKNFAIQIGITSKKFGDLLGGDTTGFQTPSGYKERNFDGKLIWMIGKKATLSLYHQQTLQKDVPLYHRVKLENFAYYSFKPQERSLNYAKLVIPSSNLLFKKISLIASYQQSNEIRSYQKNGDANRFNETDLVKTVGVNSELVSEYSKNWHSTTGIEYYFDRVNSSKQRINVGTGSLIKQRGLYPDNSTMGNFSLYTLHHLSFNKWSIDAGIRYNLLSINIKDTSTYQSNTTGIIVQPSAVVANISFLYKLTKKESIYFTFSQGFRTPNIDDMGTLGLVDFRYELPEYSLQPEKSNNFELGYKMRKQKWSGSFSTYYMLLNNLISRVQLAGQQINGYNVFIKQNNQESYIYGVEFDLSYNLLNNLTVKAGSSYTFGENVSRNEPMRRIPPFNGSLMLAYDAKKWTINIEQLFASSQNRLAQGDKDDNRIPKGGTPGWYILNFYFGYNPMSKIGFRMGLMNIFNSDYRLHGSGINGAGRNAFIGANLKLTK